MKIPLSQIVPLIQGNVEGDENIEITGPGSIENAPPGSLTFFADLKYEPYLYTSQAAVVIISEDYDLKEPIKPVVVRVKDVRVAMATLQKYIAGLLIQHPSGISEKSDIHASAALGDNVAVSAFVTIGADATIGAGTILYPNVYIGPSVTIGSNCIIYPGTRIMHGSQIGNHCILQPNVVIGSEGFGFAPKADGTYEKIPQLGHVILEDHVEIGAHATIDRAMMTATVLKQGAKIDNLVQIAHNVTVGSHTVIAAQAGIAGSTTIGSYAQIGGQVGVVGHLSIADGVRVQAQSGVNKKIKEKGSKWYGSPAIEYGNYQRSYVVFKKLPDLQKSIYNLEKWAKSQGFTQD